MLASGLAQKDIDLDLHAPGLTSLFFNNWKYDLMNVPHHCGKLYGKYSALREQVLQWLSMVVSGCTKSLSCPGKLSAESREELKPRVGILCGRLQAKASSEIINESIASQITGTNL